MTIIFKDSDITFQQWMIINGITAKTMTIDFAPGEGSDQLTFALYVCFLCG